MIWRRRSRIPEAQSRFKDGAGEEYKSGDPHPACSQDIFQKEFASAIIPAIYEITTDTACRWLCCCFAFPGCDGAGPDYSDQLGGR